MSSSYLWVESTSWELPFFGLPSRIPWPADVAPEKANEEPFDHEQLIRAIEAMGEEAGEPWKGYLAASEHFDGVAELLEDSECPEATTLLDEIDTTLPGTSFVAFHRGIVAQQEGRYADAIQHFETAATKTPKVPAIWLQLGMLEAQENNRDKAIAALNQAAKLNPRDRTPFEALASLKAAVKALRDPNDPNSVTYLSIGQYKQVCEKQLQELQNNPQGLVEFGEFQIQHKFAPEYGVRALERARQLNPQDPRTLAALSGGYSATEAHDQAKAVAEELTTLLPDDPRAWVNLAQIRSAAGDTEGERAALERTLELDPNAPPALAKIYEIDKGPNPEGERRLAEHGAKNKATVALLLASDCANGRGDYPTALDYAAQAFALEPEREEVLLQYCAMISATKDEARLRRDIEPALQSGNYTKRLDWNFAHALKALGHVQEACNALITAASAEGTPEDFQHTVGTTIDLWNQRLAQSDLPLDRNALGGLSHPVILSLDGEDGAVLMKAGQTLPAENRFPWRVRLDGNGETRINLQQGQSGSVLDPIKLGTFAVKTPPVTGGAHTIQCLLGAGPDGKLLFKAMQGNRELPVRWLAPRP